MREILFSIMVIFLASCSNSQPELKSSADKAIDNWPCSNATSLMFDVAYKSLADLNHVPTVDEMRETFEEALKGKNSTFNKRQYLEHVEKFYSMILDSYKKTHTEAPTAKALLGYIAAIEVGNRSDIVAEAQQNQLQEYQESYAEFVIKNNGQCVQAPPPEIEPAPSPTQDPVASPGKGRGVANPIAWGANKTMAVAYQSCASIDKAELVSSTPNAQGITITGPNGAGFYRKISDLSALLKTDYYLQGFTVQPQCKDISKSPLIYDFGGKPYASPSVRTLDFFTDSGTGGSVLGIDCSGFVFSSIVSSGLRLSPKVAIKPIQVYGVGAVMYKEPQKNGLACFSKIPVGATGTIKEGDVAATSSHVIIIGATGQDPLGVLSAKNNSDCAMITSDDFDFVIIQSSPSKNGIGINKFKAKDYLKESLTMKTPFEEYAQRACMARLKNKDITLSGLSMQIVRHSQSADCLETKVSLVGEDCISSCSMLQ